MTEHPQAGARVRIVIEDTIESRSEAGDWTTTGGINLTGVTTANATTTILEPGWQPGDIVNDGHNNLIRIQRQDGVQLWQGPDGRPVYDDETSLASLTVVHRASLPADAHYTIHVTQTPDDANAIGRQVGRALRREWPGGLR
ncbi:hypothetical protein [Streptomyces sp. NPDC001658]